MTNTKSSRRERVMMTVTKRLIKIFQNYNDDPVEGISLTEQEMNMKMATAVELQDTLNAIGWPVSNNGTLVQPK